jgi:hypothetical protein
MDLCVWKTLKRGRLNHWMLWGCPEVYWTFDDSLEELDDDEHYGREYYTVGPIRLRLLMAFEALCGYRLTKLGPVWIFEKVA